MQERGMIKASALLLGPDSLDLLAVLLDACVILLSSVRCTSRMIAFVQNSNSKADVNVVGAFVRVYYLSPRSLHNIHCSDIGLR